MRTTEPAAIAAGIAAGINAVVLFALNHELAPDLRSAIVVIVTAVAGWVIRSKVSPVA